MTSEVSAAVSERLVATLQSENQALRCENRDITEELDQTKEAATQAEESAAALAEENAKLRRKLEKLERQIEAAANTPPVVAAIPGADDLEREIVSALSEALGVAGPDGMSTTFESAAGAARRAVRDKTSSGLAAAAVRTAKRAQAAWLAEHNKLRDEAQEAQRAEAARLVELEEAHATIRKLKLEINTLRRRLENLMNADASRIQVPRDLDAEPPPAPLPVPLPAGHARNAQEGSAFKAFMENKMQQQMQQQQQSQPQPPQPRREPRPPPQPPPRGLGASSREATSSAEPPNNRLPPLSQQQQQQQASSAPPGSRPPPQPHSNFAADPVKTAAALQSMTTALQQGWQRHVRATQGQAARPPLNRQALHAR